MEAVISAQGIYLLPELPANPPPPPHSHTLERPPESAIKITIQIYLVIYKRLAAVPLFHGVKYS